MNWWRPYYEAYLMYMYLPECHRREVEKKIKGFGLKAFLWWFVVHLIPCSCIIVFLIWLDFHMRH